MNNKKTYTRSELHKLVWAKPITQLAKEIEVKEYIIRKICKKANIPLPFSGYWSKIYHNKKVKVATLPKNIEWDDKIINFDNLPISDIEKRYLTVGLKREDIEKHHSKYLSVPKRLSNPTPSILEAKNDLMNKDNHYRYKNLTTKKTNLKISVTKNTIARSLRFADTFIKLVLDRGHHFEGHHIIILGQKYPLRLVEKYNIKKIKDDRWRATENVYNGKLSLKIDKSYNDKEWTDSKVLIENKLANILAELEFIAEKDIEEKIKRDAFWAEQKRLELLEEQRLAEEAWENEKVDLLFDHASDWERTENLKRFITEIENRVKDTDSYDQYESWINWAKGIAKTSNPLENGLTHFIDEYRFKG